MLATCEYRDAQVPLSSVPFKRCLPASLTALLYELPPQAVSSGIHWPLQGNMYTCVCTGTQNMLYLYVQIDSA